MEEIQTEGVKFLNPFLGIYQQKKPQKGIIRKGIYKERKTGFDLDKNEVSKAVDKAG